MPSVTNTINTSICYGLGPTSMALRAIRTSTSAPAARNTWRLGICYWLRPCFSGPEGWREVWRCCRPKRKRRRCLLLAPTRLLRLKHHRRVGETAGQGPLNLQPRDQLLAMGGGRRPAQDSPRSRLRVHPHDGLSDAYLAAGGPESKEHLARLDLLLGKLPSRSGCGVPHHG